MSVEGQRGVAAMRLDEWLYLILLGALPLMRPFNLRLSGSVVYLADLLFIMAAALWLVALLRGRATLRRSRFYYPLALYLGALGLSAAFSPDPARSAVKLVANFYLVALAVLTFNLVSSHSSLRRATQTWLAGTALTLFVGLAGIVLFYAGVKSLSLNPALSIYGSLSPGHYPRIRALFTNPNMLCNFLSVSCSLLLMSRVLGWVSARWFRLLFTGICLIAIFTLSPGIGGLSLSIALWTWLTIKDTKPRLAALILSGGVVTALLFLAASATLSTRLIIWQHALETFVRHPLIGQGLGTPVSYVSAAGASAVLRQNFTDAHNIWLNVAAQGGVLALVAFAGIVVYLLRQVKSLRVVGEPNNVVIVTALALAFCDAFLYQGLTGAFEETRHLWVLTGMLAATAEGLRDEMDDSPANDIRQMKDTG